MRRIVQWLERMAPVRILLSWRRERRISTQAMASARALLRQALIDSVPGSEGDQQAVEFLEERNREMIREEPEGEDSPPPEGEGEQEERA